MRDDELLARYPDLPRDVEWVPLVHARALPGGAVEREFYESIKTELIARLRAVLPVQGVLLDIHGAMSVVGYGLSKLLGTRAPRSKRRAVRL